MLPVVGDLIRSGTPINTVERSAKACLNACKSKQGNIATFSAEGVCNVYNNANVERGQSTASG